MGRVGNEFCRKVGDSMYPASQDLIEAVKARERIVDAKIEIDGVEYSSEYIQSFTYEAVSNPENYLMVGSVSATKVELSLLDISSAVILENAEYKLYVGIEVNGEMEYIPLGVFYADPDSIKRKKNVATLTLYDGMLKAQREYISELVYPTSLIVVAHEIATMLGVSFVGTLPSYTIPEKPVGYSCRGMIGIIAQLAGGFATFDRNGNLTIRHYTSADYSIDGDNYIEYEKQRDSLYKINRVVGRIINEEGETIEYAAGAARPEMIIENPFITQAIVNDIYNRYVNFAYIPTFVNLQGNPLVDCGDIVQLTTVDNEIINIPIMRHKLTFAGGLLSEIESVGESERQESFKPSGSIGEKIDQITDQLAKSVFVNIVSSAGNLFRNSVGSTTLTAKTFLTGNEIDVDGARFDYRWHKFDKNGNYVPDFYEYSKSITVYASEIDEKATYRLELILDNTVIALQEITLTNVYDGEQGPIGPEGPQGPKGDTGQSVVDIVPEYYKSDSNTEQTGGEWSEEKPAYQEGKYLWVRYKVVYTNPDKTEYTTPVVDDSWEALGKADEAIEKSNVALVSADGKNTVFFQSQTPPLDNRKIGDLWFKSDEGNRMYRWTGQWEPVALDHRALSIDKLSAISANLGSVTAGTINGVNIYGSNIFGSYIDTTYNIRVGDKIYLLGNNGSGIIFGHEDNPTNPGIFYNSSMGITFFSGATTTAGSLYVNGSLDVGNGLIMTSDISNYVHIGKENGQTSFYGYVDFSNATVWNLNATYLGGYTSSEFVRTNTPGLEITRSSNNPKGLVVKLWGTDIGYITMT